MSHDHVTVSHDHVIVSLDHIIVSHDLLVDVPDVSVINVPQMLSFEEQYSQRNPIILTTTEDTRYLP